MFTLRTLTALSVAFLLGACANPGPMSDSSPSASTAPIATPDSRVKAMQDMHQKMVNAGTPAERQALMADHLKAMQGGMAMMKEMHTMHGHGDMGGMGGTGGMDTMRSPGGAAPMAGMGHREGMPTDMAKRHQMMADHMAMMQMMMDMMADRMPPASTVR